MDEGATAKEGNMKMFTIILGMIVALAATAPVAFANPDMVGSKDHPLFTRMPGYYIENYAASDFDRHEFVGEGGVMTAVEGKKTVIGYMLNSGAKPASPLQIARNYQNALAKIGGTVVFEDIGSGGGQTTLKLVRGADEIWASVRIGDGGNNYNLTVVEKSGMGQDVVADAETWKSDINTTGHAAIYGIYFDTDKSVLKPESEPALEEIAKLLNQNPKLDVFIVGHTDSKGDLAHNMTLSEERAKAVVAALTSKHGITASRLTAKGCGPLAPVASNDTDEGRGKNRRVELVKQ
jgi:outer membrane protein OmpA-like peptidoglycan-associated protein